MALRILWREGGLLAVSKPAGLASQGGDGLRGENLVDLARKELSAPRAAVLNRLDRNVSGIVLLALDAESARAMSRAIAAGNVERSYLAAVRGTPPSDRFELDSWLMKDERRNLVTVLPAHEALALEASQRARFKPALTRVHVLERFSAPLGRCALLEVTLETGRSHQIRAHLAHANLKVIGDPKYGVPAKGVDRPLLHAARLVFRSTRGETVTVEDPPPPLFDPGQLRALARPANTRSRAAR